MNHAHQTGSQTFDHITLGERPRSAEEDPATIQRELVLAVDRLAIIRASAPEIENAASAARSNFERAGVDVHAALLLVRSLEVLELQALDALTAAEPADVEARLADLSARRTERRLAIDDMNEKQKLADGAHRSLAMPRKALDDLRTEEAQTLRDIETWRGRAKAHPVPRREPIIVDKIASPADQRAHAANYADAAAQTRAQFLASLPPNLRAPLEADAAAMNEALGHFTAGRVVNAIETAVRAETAATKGKSK